MQILYFGSACDKDWFNKTIHDRLMPCNIAQYLFEMALIEGLTTQPDCAIELEAYYLQLEPYYPQGFSIFYKSQIICNFNKVIIKCVPGVNIPILKELLYFFGGLVLTLKWIINNRKHSQKIILTPFQYTPLALGVMLVTSFFHVKRVNVFTDLSSDIMNENRQRSMIWIKRFILPVYRMLVFWVESNYDFYILFTNAMGKIVNPNRRPFLIMEGIFNGNLDLTPVDKVNAIMHAGTLSFEYGVKTILDAFEHIPDVDLQLWLFGDGDMRTYIKDLCNRDSRVVYFGFRPHDEVFLYEKKARLLINTRDYNHKYTQYSFPSKTFEYMVSGTPFLTTRIGGIPDEYYKYLYTIENCQEEHVKNMIEKILASPQFELDAIGKSARDFILCNKNCIIQAKSIITSIQAIL